MSDSEVRPAAVAAHPVSPEPESKGMRPLTLGLILAVIAALILTYVVFYSVSNHSDSTPRWGAPSTNIAQHARDGGLSVLPKEGTKEHIHPHLTITFDGKRVQVPALIGIDQAKGQYSEIHTHDTSGILHVESAKPRPFYLGQVFDEWNVELKTHGVGGYNDSEWGVRVAAFVNGKPYTGSLRWLELQNKQQIVIAVTTNGDVPQDAPAFKYPQGY